MCDMTHSYVYHDSVIVWNDSFILQHHVWHDSFTCVTWLIHMCDMTHPYVWHDSFIRLIWLIHTCDQNEKNSRMCRPRRGLVWFAWQEWQYRARARSYLSKKNVYIYIYIYITPILKWPYSQDYRVVCWISCDSRSLKIVYFNAR